MKVQPTSRPAQRAGADDGRLVVYRLIPTAARSDRRFARDAYHGEVVVRARSPADARLAAAEAEAAALGADVLDASPFRDERLYSVIEVTGAGFLRAGKRGLIAGRFARMAAH